MQQTKANSNWTGSTIRRQLARSTLSVLISTSESGSSSETLLVRSRKPLAGPDDCDCAAWGEAKVLARTLSLCLHPCPLQNSPVVGVGLGLGICRLPLGVRFGAGPLGFLLLGFVLRDRIFFVRDYPILFGYNPSQLVLGRRCWCSAPIAVRKSSSGLRHHDARRLL